MIFIRNIWRFRRHSDENAKYFFDLAWQMQIFRAAAPGLSGRDRQ
jgi:hypothetical protein